MLLKTSALAIFSVLMAAGGQLLLRDGMQRVGYVGVPQLTRPLQLLLQVVKTPQIAVGLSLFVISAATWLVVLSRAPLSFAYPFAGLTYVITVLFSKYVLQEQVPGLRWLGVALIITGIVMVGRTAPPGLE